MCVALRGGALRCIVLCECALRECALRYIWTKKPFPPCQGSTVESIMIQEGTWKKYAQIEGFHLIEDK